MTEAKAQAEEVANGAKKAAHAAKNNPWVDRAARIGYAVRGMLYGLIGVLAIQLIFTGQGKLTGREGALETIAKQPLGEVLLIVIAVGLVGMALWGLIRAVADPFHRGHDFKGIITRLGYLVSGISYGALVYPTLNMILGADSQAGDETQNARRAAAGIMANSWGPWLVGLVGLGFMIVGIVQFVRAFKTRFDEHFKRYEMTSSQRKWANRMGRIGTAAHGVVFLIIGSLALLAALTLDPEKVGGLDHALSTLASQPYGPYLLGVVALGLIANAIYSFMSALWFRIKSS